MPWNSFLKEPKGGVIEKYYCRRINASVLLSCKAEAGIFGAGIDILLKGI